MIDFRPLLIRTKADEFMSRVEKLDTTQKRFFKEILINPYNFNQNQFKSDYQVKIIKLDENKNLFNFYDFKANNFSGKELVFLRKENLLPAESEINFFNWSTVFIKDSTIIKKSYSTEKYISELNKTGEFSLRFLKKGILLSKFNFLNKITMADIMTPHFSNEFIEYLLFWRQHRLWLNSFNVYSLRYKGGVFDIFDPEIFYINGIHDLPENFQKNFLKDTKTFLEYFLKSKFRKKYIIYEIKNPISVPDEVFNFLYLNYHMMQKLANSIYKKINT